MDPRLIVNVAEVRVMRKNSRDWRVPRSYVVSKSEKYLYPDAPSTEYSGVDPVFYLGDEKYYFVLLANGKLSARVIKTTHPEPPIPDKGSDPRLHIEPNVVKITLQDGYEWYVSMDRVTDSVRPYLYPDRPGSEWHDQDPVFLLGEAKYYFALNSDSKLAVVLVVEPGSSEVPIVIPIDPTNDTGMYRVPLADGKHVWCKVDDKTQWEDLPEPKQFTETGEPIYTVSGLTYYVVIDYAQEPPYASMHRYADQNGEDPQVPTECDKTRLYVLKTAEASILLLAIAGLAVLGTVGKSL